MAPPVPEIAAWAILCSLTGKEKRSSSGNVKGGDEKWFQSVEQHELRSIFSNDVLIVQALELSWQVLGSVQLSHRPEKRIIPARNSGCLLGIIEIFKV
jgi:hypothetical protein